MGVLERFVIRKGKNRVAYRDTIPSTFAPPYFQIWEAGVIPTYHVFGSSYHKGFEFLQRIRHDTSFFCLISSLDFTKRNNHSSFTIFASTFMKKITSLASSTL